MTVQGLKIHAAVASDNPDWRAMWDSYCAFYETKMPEEVTRATWGRILDPQSSISCLIARCAHTGEAFGMCNYIIHANTWTLNDVCYLEDLYAHPHIRGTGVGRALIDRLVALGKENGWTRIYWHTRNNNAYARRLYDHYAKADDFVRYVVRV
jgi:GNAT superfamily N-acetyltransferase